MVLSGGSARGIAHAGVLVGLEQRGHDPDIVVGASMGAVLGALYATGQSADSVRAIVQLTRWRELFTPFPVAVGSARDIRSPILRLHGGASGGPVIQGLVSDWQVNRELVHRLFGPSARARGDFDRLPRRFRAVATDIGSGKLVVLDHGDLARAVRASLSEPGFFPPVSWNGALLVDGVLRDYLPVDPARAMGAKVVIASDVVMPESTGFRTDAASIAERAINLLTVHARGSTSQPDARITPHIDPSPSPLIYPTDPSRLIHAGLEAALAAELPAPETAGAPVPSPAPSPRDTVVTPAARDTASMPAVRDTAAAPAARDTLALPHHSISAFGDSLATQARLDSLAAQASLEGLAVQARLDSLAAVARRDSLEAVAWRDSLARVRAAVVADSLAAVAIRDSLARLYSAPTALVDLRLEDIDPAVAPLVRRAFDKVPGPFDEQRVLDAVDRLYATALFTGLWPSVEDSVFEPEAPLVVRADATGSPSILGALAYDNDRGGRAWVSLLSTKSLAGSPVELSLEGSANGIESEATASARLAGVGRGSHSWTLGGLLSETDVRFPSSNRGTPDVHRAGGWIGVETRQIEPARYASLSFVAEHVTADEGPEGDSFGPVLHAGEVPEFAPVVGLASELQVEARFGSLSYESGRARVSHTFSKHGRSAAPLLVLEAASGDAPWDRLPALGDAHLVPGLDWGDRRGRLVGAAGADFSQVIPWRATLVLRLREGRVAKREAEGDVPDEWVGGGSLSAFWWLPIGRAELGFAAATTGDRRIDVGLGTDF
ncbi:MAG TPA: patatin-like phospholipase family protein [Candidatus Eisenbacteria bacterium]|nr:patatin-like phospholipase family protein [Candidatus Eisenbacteria bacterium]